MIDYTIVCNDCKVSIFVANQNCHCQSRGVVNFFNDNIEKILCDHLGHNIVFAKDERPWGYKQFGNFTKEYSKLVEIVP